MPIVNIDAAWLNRLLGRTYPIDTLTDTLEQIGCDVEDVVDIARYRCPQCGALVEAAVGSSGITECPFCGFAGGARFTPAGNAQAIRLDLLAARPDLFDVGGLARALRGIFGLTTGLPEYRVEPSDVTVIADDSIRAAGCNRPHIRCAVVTMPPLAEDALVAIMKLQENLHWGVGRDRKLASIGIYDLDTVSRTIHYRSADPRAERFTPLGMPGTTMSGREILEKHPKGTAYRHLLDDSERYPLLVDDRGQVLSMPPIINSEETKLRPGSQRLFVDVTGISELAVIKSLDTLVGSLAEIGGRPGSVRHVLFGETVIWPTLEPGTLRISLEAARRWLGIPFDMNGAVSSFRKMRLDAVPGEDGDAIEVTYPAFRTDIRHMVDLFEDLAIGYGFANVEPRFVETATVAAARPEEDLSALARTTLLGLGFTEVMSLPLATEEQHYLRFREPVPAHYPRIANPKIKALTVAREHLLSGLMDALEENRRRPMPLRLFEMDNVVALDPAAETGTIDERRVAFVEMGPNVGFAQARATMDALLHELGDTATYAPIDLPMFTPGRGAVVRTASGRVGRIGELHPSVITGASIRPGIDEGADPPLLDQPTAIGELTLMRIR